MSNQARSDICVDIDSASGRHYVDLTLNQRRLKYRRRQRRFGALVAIIAHCITYGICTTIVYLFYQQTHSVEFVLNLR